MEIIEVPDLANACQMAREDPDLKIVSQTDIDNLQVYDWAKLSHEGERFEVKVEEVITVGDQFVGSVRSDLAFKHPFKYGDFISFQSKNIFNVYGWASVETNMAIEVYQQPDKG